MVSFIALSAAEDVLTTDKSQRLQVSIDPLTSSLIFMADFVVTSSALVPTVRIDWLEREGNEVGILILIEFGSSLVSGVMIALLPCTSCSHFSPGTPPSVSFRSTRPVGWKLTSMNAYL